MKGGKITMQNVIEFLKDLSSEKLKLSERSGSPIITTTQRSEVKSGFMNALMKDLKQATDTATDENVLENDVILGFTADGLVLALAHDSLNKLKIAQEVPFKIEVKIGNLDFDTSREIEMYQLEQDEKKAEKERKAVAKAKKIAYDKNRRENELKAKGYETE
jgi:hypothetical protein